MKYKRYVLKFQGDPAMVAFLKSHVKEQHTDLQTARALGRAAKLLLNVDYEVASITLPRASAEKVKSL